MRDRSLRVLFAVAVRFELVVWRVDIDTALTNTTRQGDIYIYDFLVTFISPNAD